MGAAVITTGGNKRIMKFCFDCVPWTKPIDVIMKESGTGPQRGEPKGSVHNTLLHTVQCCNTFLQHSLHSRPVRRAALLISFCWIVAFMCPTKEALYEQGTRNSQ